MERVEKSVVFHHSANVDTQGVRQHRVARHVPDQNEVIRVHMSESGWPLLGDPIYGRLPRKGPLRDIAEAALRTMLHAAHLELTHPETGSWLEFTREPPDDFRQIADRLAAL